MNNNFTFEGKQKSILLSGIGLGIVCMVLTFFMGDHGAVRFWSNFLHNSVFFTGIAYTALFVIAAFTTAYAGWFIVIKRIWEAISLFLVVGLVLMMVIAVGLWMGYHDLYHWGIHGVADVNSETYDALIAGKSAFLNKGWYTFGTLAIVGSWIFFAQKLRSLSVAEDDYTVGDYGIHKKIKVWTAVFLPIGAFTSSAIIWLWVMSVDSHWYSTLYAWYATASWWVSCLCLTILIILYLKSKNYLQGVTVEHMHDLGKLTFAFSIFWTYLWFSQFMLIWYSNVGEETIYFRERMDNYPVLFWGNLALNFILPFFILMRNDTKRKMGSLAIAALVVLFGHWIDFFLMLKPGILHTQHYLPGNHGEAHHDAGGHEGAGHGAEHVSDAVAGFTMPGLLEIGTFIGFLCLFLFVVYTHISKASLLPKNDPYVEESLHHHS